MNKILLLGIGFLLILIVSCVFNIADDTNTNNPNDTITGWESAGIVSPGDSGHHVDVCHYQGHLFTFNYRGELFHSLYPDFSWSLMSIPDENKVYDLFCDTIKGKLYITTREKSCSVYEYNIRNDNWYCLAPKKNSWFDSTKLLDGELYLRMYSVAVHNDKVFMMSAQGWTTITGDTRYVPTIWCSNRDTIWEKADSGWYNENERSDQITSFFSIDGYLYATTFEHGLWRYDGIYWEIIPGTTQEDVHEIIDSGGDTKTIPGFRPRSVIKHNNELYVGNLGGFVHKLLPGNTWDRIGLFFIDYNANDTLEFGNPSMSLYSYNGYLIKQTYYFSESADLWYNMTPNFNKIDTMYVNGLPGIVYGMTNIGDTLFAALGNNEGKHSGVYFLDLKTRKWYNSFTIRNK